VTPEAGSLLKLGFADPLFALPFVKTTPCKVARCAKGMTALTCDLSGVFTSTSKTVAMICSDRHTADPNPTQVWSLRIGYELRWIIKSNACAKKRLKTNRESRNGI
jgi:hypothetical protein